jgi:peptidoglycan/LPS O-acetylase OafA/YrhL
MRKNSKEYRWAVAIALATAAMLVWLSLGVGIIGKDGDPANRMYFGVLAIGIIGAIIARFEPHGMARALFAAALGQAAVTVIALYAGLGLPYSGPAEIVLLNAFFIAAFVTSAVLFKRSARPRPEHGI